MKATLGLLTDRVTFNAASGLAWEMHLRFAVGVDVRRLPLHVSLKQPFDCNDLPGLVRFAERFATDVAPVAVELMECEMWEQETSGVLSVQVAETGDLRALHDRLNHELAASFGPCPAPFDGAAYRFHLTLAAGQAPPDAWRAGLDFCRAQWQPLAFVARELALFVYDQDASGEWQYLTYHILPLGATEEQSDERFARAA